MKLIYIAVLCLISTSLSAQDFWEKIDYDYTAPIEENRVEKYSAFKFSLSELKNHLREAPKFNENYSLTEEQRLELPMPDGSTAEFVVENSPMLAAGLAAKYPQIKTYQVTKIGDKRVFGRLSITEKGFHGMILGDKNGAIFIDPASNVELEKSVVYYKKDFHSTKKGTHSCGVTGHTEENHRGELNISSRAGSISLYKYRLAVCTTAEYALYHSSAQSTSAVMSAITVTINRINTIYQKDLAILFELVTNNDLLISFNTNTDAFTNNNANQLIIQSHNKCSSLIGASNYDIGHVFSTGAGGLAQLSSVCVSWGKGRGCTGTNAPIGDAYDIDYVAHEIGHQMGANHTFNNCPQQAGNQNYPTGKEPGSGSTIMAYAGICGNANNVQTFSHPYFHAVSLSEINTNTRTSTSSGSTCKEIVPNTNNTKPDVVMPISSNFKIPKSTPFELEATATDVDGDELTYIWEQYDHSFSGASLGAPSGNSPSFRSLEPDNNNKRVFPKMSTLLINGSDKTEVLPSYGRNLSFKFVVRDNHSTGGGYTFGDLAFTVDATAGPFTVSFPNLAFHQVNDNELTEVTWNVANTNSTSGVNCQAVDIYLSLTNSENFDILVAGNVPNTGSAMVTFPEVGAAGVSTARLKIKAADNIFFDISNSFFKINHIEGSSIDNISDSDDLNVFPNPFNNKLTLEQKNFIGAMEVNIFSSNGQLVHQSNWDGEQYYTISTASFAKGSYILQLRNGENIFYAKLLK